MITPFRGLIAISVLISATAFCPPRAIAADFWLEAAPPPSAPRVESVPVLGPDRVWSPGYYRWTGQNHRWVSGHVRDARPGYTWVPDHWEPDGRRWLFVTGHWIPNSMVAG